MGKVETSLIEWGAAALTLPGQSRSGDRQAVMLFPGGALVAVVDGLGHGELAAVPAETAIEALERYAREPVVALIQRCHERLRGTRGAVMSLASFREADSTMTWLGVGNVVGVLLRADPGAVPRQEYLSLRGGVVGDQLPRLDASVHSGRTRRYADSGERWRSGRLCQKSASRRITSAGCGPYSGGVCAQN